MNATKKIEMYFNKIQSIRFENENGGTYAYIQYLAYTRELLALLRPLKRVERQVETLEGINWLFNEHLAFKFSPRHKVIFEEKMYETKNLFDNLRQTLEEINRPLTQVPGVLHAQAA